MYKSASKTKIDDNRVDLDHIYLSPILPVSYVQHSPQRGLYRISDSFGAFLDLDMRDSSQTKQS